eukprot:jgi/Mesvir1/7603/Mv06335-RA.1
MVSLSRSWIRFGSGTASLDTEVIRFKRVAPWHRWQPRCGSVQANSVRLTASQSSNNCLMGRVLSIQSHTVHGYVGNKCAVFPLQLLGFDVDAINSVQFSNHTGYPAFQGQVLTGEQLWQLVEGLDANGLLSGYSHLLTGYIGSESILSTILRLLELLRARNKDVVFVCDPVLGDNGTLYVKPALVPLFRSSVVGAATLLTPNQFEAEQLTGMSIRSESDALAACDALHAQGPPLVVITSLDVPGSDGHLVVLGSEVHVAADGTKSAPARFRLRIPKLDAYFTGSGDLFTALILGWSTRRPGQLAAAVEVAVATLQAVLRRTLEHAGGVAALQEAERTGGAARMAVRELRLIESRDDIIAPTLTLRAEIIP